jgi:uncharacterized repeat protein (TIGR03847 family)
MSEVVYEFNPTSHITIGAVGQPGRRTFFLQASQGERLISLKLEKEQVVALARAIETILEELEQRELRPVSSLEEPSGDALALRQPVEPAFVAGQMALAFDQASGLLVLVVQEAAETGAAEGPPLQVARFWAGLGQMRALSRVAREVAGQGRPICPLCGNPIDPGGHFCPRGNGHDQVPTV